MTPKLEHRALLGGHGPRKAAHHCRRKARCLLPKGQAGAAELNPIPPFRQSLIKPLASQVDKLRRAAGSNSIGRAQIWELPGPRTPKKLTQDDVQVNRQPLLSIFRPHFPPRPPLTRTAFWGSSEMLALRLSTQVSGEQPVQWRCALPPLLCSSCFH